MIHVHDEGAGPAVLLLHGMPSSVEAFAPLVEALRSSRRVLVPELPGYGRSPAWPGAYDLVAVNAALEAALRARAVAEVAVVGFSAGAYRAYELATAGRFRVTHLVSLSGFAGLDAAERAAVRGLVAAARAGADLRAGWLDRMMGPGAPQRLPREAEEVSRWLDCAPLDVLLAELEAASLAEDLRPKLRALRIPVLARTGASDAACPPTWDAALAAACPQAVVQRVPGCGHALLYEDRADTVRAVCDALGVVRPG